MKLAVNNDDWTSLSADDKARIQSIIQSHFPNVKGFSPGADVDKSEARVLNMDKLAFNLSNPLCTAACGVAEAAAVAACSALSGGIAVAVCVAAAHEAGNFCRSKC